VSKKIISWGLRLEVDYDDGTSATLTGADVSEWLSEQIDQELTEIEGKDE